MNVAVVIPAYRPDHCLIDIVRRLSRAPFRTIVVVDDGSGPEYLRIFGELRDLPGVSITSHPGNRGKGAALKTGFETALREYPDLSGIVTADADGQHHVDDILRVAESLSAHSDCLIMGARTFDSGVPLRSRAGNLITRAVFRALVGLKLSDTQTGLRGIPAALLPALLRIKSTGYKFELEMVIKARERSCRIVEEKIRTIYGPGNSTSHFHPLIDSLRVYTVFVPFLLTWIIFGLAVGIEVYGFESRHLFSQHAWSAAGLQRLERYTALFGAASFTILLIAPWAFAAASVAFAGIATAAAVGPVPVLVVCAFFWSSAVLGLKVFRRPAILGGVSLYIFVMTFLGRTPLNYTALYVALLIAPLLLFPKTALACVPPRLELRSWPSRLSFGLLVYVLMAHWLVVLKPEVSADGLAMHLAIPANVALHHVLTYQPKDVAWSVMPMGADWCYTLVYLPGGEYAARLLNFGMLLIIEALLFRFLRRWLSSSLAWLTLALFAATPMVQLVTGSLFVENLLAALILCGIGWVGESACPTLLSAACLGTALATKLGSLPFVLCALPFTLRRRGRAAWVALLLLTAAPTYLIAFVKTRNPVFPFLNRVFSSPLLDPSVSFDDLRFHVPLSFRTPFQLTFDTSRFWEGQNGSLGFQYLFLILLGIWMLLWKRDRRTAGIIAVSLAASGIVLIAQPNARYLYPALPMLMILAGPIAAGLRQQSRILQTGTLVAMLTCLLLNIWFLPSSSSYHKDFYSAPWLTKEGRDHYLDSTAPVREAVDYLNRTDPSGPVLFTDTSDIAGLIAPAFVNHWHQYRVRQSILNARSAQDVLTIAQDLHIRHVIVPGAAGIPSPAVQHFLSVCTDPERQYGNVSIERVNPDCAPRNAFPAAAPPGVYDDTDPRIFFIGAWGTDNQFDQTYRHTVTYSNAPGAEIHFAFEGRQLAWVYTRAFNRGIAEVRIDDAAPQRVDLFSSATLWQQRSTFRTGARGRHTATIRVTGEKNPQAGDYFVDLDALTVE